MDNKKANENATALLKVDGNSQSRTETDKRDNWRMRSAGSAENVGPSTSRGSHLPQLFVKHKRVDWRTRPDSSAENISPSTSRGNHVPQFGKHRRHDNNWRAREIHLDDNSDIEKRREIRHRVGFKFLEATANITNDDDALNEIMSKKPQVFEFLATAYSLDDCDNYILLMKILNKVHKSSFTQLKSQLLLEIAKSKLSENLQLYLTKLPYQTEWEKTRNRLFWKEPLEFWDNFLSYCENVHTLSPYYAFEKCRPVLDVAIKLCLPLLDKKHDFKLPEEYGQRLETIKNKIFVRETQSVTKETELKKHVDYGPAPQNFRELNIIPTLKDLFDSNPYVRPNIIDGSFESVEHYLDVQFRLLREDCYGPLRIGLQQFRNDMTKKRYDNLRVHKNIVVTRSMMTHNQFGVVVKWDTSKKKYSQNINWEQSKRFMFGSLLLFVKDNFEDVLIGTVLDRDVRLLSQGLVVVQFYKTDLLQKNFFEENYHMLECLVYFEPYLHVLKALQDPKFSKHLAMSKYIVSVDHTSTPPVYLTKNTKIVIRTLNGKKTFNVLDEEAWPNSHEIALDESQYEAYKSALTQEFVIIQGPPGTGKTYLGARIGHTLLTNSLRFQEALERELYQTAIRINGDLAPNIDGTETENKIKMEKYLPFCCRLLVLCYTNHALDQFLGKFMHFSRYVVRIGGQSKNKDLDRVNLTQRRTELIKVLGLIRRKEIDKWEASERTTFSVRTLERAEMHSRAYLDMKSELEYFKYRLITCKEEINIFNEGVYSYEAVAFYCHEVRCLKGYHGMDADPLLSWLFENVKIDLNEIKLDHMLFDHLEDIDILINAKSVKSSFSVSRVTTELAELYTQYDSPDTEDTSRFNIEYQIIHLQSRLLFFKHIMKKKGHLKKISILDKEHVSDFTTEERWSIYFDWASTVKQYLSDKYRRLKYVQERCLEAYEESRMMIDLDILREARIVGVTTTGAARIRKLLQALAIPIVIVEEAAEVLEAHIISALTEHCKHLILIGDHQQLRPSAAFYKLAQHFNLEVSLFERMVNTGMRAKRLHLQHRMRPEIAALVSPAIYPDLRNHPSVLEYPPVRGFTTNLYFFTHNNHEEIDDEMLSHSNYFEADMILNLANYLMKQGYHSEDVTILATYSSQMVYLKNNRSRFPFLEDVKITVVDNYQGEESKIILLSLVRNNDEGNVGFLATDNRVCVALTRAREGMYIMGNIDMLKKKSELWTKIATTLESNGSLGTRFLMKCPQHPDYETEVRCCDDFLKIPEGGCLRKCEALLECGHGCPLVCHSYDHEHTDIKCIEKCKRVLCDLGHVCPKDCADYCGECCVIVKKVMPCGHTNELFCHIMPDDENVKCHINITVTLPACGHETKKPCYLNLNDAQCSIKCQEPLPCGHMCRSNCHKNNDPEHEKYECNEVCAKTKLDCSVMFADGDDLRDHKCLKKCYEKCDPCLVKVTKRRRNCAHRDIVECSTDIDSTPCTKKCSRALPCKHFCKNKCFEPCTPNCMQPITKKVAECGHKVKIACSVTPTRKHCSQRCKDVLEDLLLHIEE